jgi:2-oxoglutarate ferredoxin oxidoreductase subunit alpha
VFQRREGATLGVVTIGGCAAAAKEAMAELEAAGVPIEYMRIRGFPFSEAVVEFLKAHETNFIVEQNRDAQLLNMLMLETQIPLERLKSVRHYGGLPMSSHHIVTGIRRRWGRHDLHREATRSTSEARGQRDRPHAPGL